MSAPENLKNIIEAALLAAGGPLSLDAMQALFLEEEMPEKKQLREVLKEFSEDYTGRGIEIAEVASGWRIQATEEVSPWISRLWSERPARYSRALMETLALIAYRQPITRGEIEDIRGVSVSTNIVKTLLEREWIRVVGQRDVPGKPSLYGTTREFLDYFNLKSLDDLPTLAEIRDLDEINRELDLEDTDKVSDEPANDAQGQAQVEAEAETGDVAEGQEASDDLSEGGDLPLAVPAEDEPAGIEEISAQAPDHEMVVAESHPLVEVDEADDQEAVEAEDETSGDNDLPPVETAEPTETADQEGDEAEEKVAAEVVDDTAQQAEPGVSRIDHEKTMTADEEPNRDDPENSDTVVASYAPQDLVVPVKPSVEPVAQETPTTPEQGDQVKKSQAAMDLSNG